MPLPYALSRRRTINVEVLISSRQEALPHYHVRHLLDHRLIDCRNNDGITSVGQQLCVSGRCTVAVPVLRHFRMHCRDYMLCNRGLSREGR